MMTTRRSAQLTDMLTSTRHADIYGGANLRAFYKHQSRRIERHAGKADTRKQAAQIDPWVDIYGAEAHDTRTESVI